jgi:hypothetical protein
MANDSNFQIDPSLLRIPPPGSPINLAQLRSAIPVTGQPTGVAQQQISYEDLMKIVGGPAPRADIGRPGGTEGIASLADARAALRDELRDPYIRQKLIASAMAEVGEQGPEARLAYIESVMNRATSRKMSLDQTISDRSYYPASTISRLGRTFPDSTISEFNDYITTALSGSNRSNFATGNESGSVRSGGAPIMFNPGSGERFVMENTDKGWTSRLGLTD